MSKVEIKAPLPGIFYRRPSPDAPCFKNEGDTLKQGDAIGLIEVMKTFTEVCSETNGTIVRFCVENDEYVDIGQVIAEVEVS